MRRYIVIVMLIFESFNAFSQQDSLIVHFEGMLNKKREYIIEIEGSCYRIVSNHHIDHYIKLPVDNSNSTVSINIKRKRRLFNGYKTIRYFDAWNIQNSYLNIIRITNRIFYTYWCSEDSDFDQSIFVTSENCRNL